MRQPISADRGEKLDTMLHPNKRPYPHEGRMPLGPAMGADKVGRLSAAMTAEVGNRGTDNELDEPITTDPQQQQQ